MITWPRALIALALYGVYTARHQIVRSMGPEWRHQLGVVLVVTIIALVAWRVYARGKR